MSSNKGAALCRKVNDDATASPGHPHQLRARTREDGARRLGEGRRTGHLPRHCSDIGAPGSRKQRATESTKAEG
jgi:hypothetical protein